MRFDWVRGALRISRIEDCKCASVCPIDFYSVEGWHVFLLWQVGADCCLQPCTSADLLLGCVSELVFGGQLSLLAPPSCLTCNFYILSCARWWSPKSVYKHLCLYKSSTASVAKHRFGGQPAFLSVSMGLVAVSPPSIFLVWINDIVYLWPLAVLDICQ